MRLGMLLNMALLESCLRLRQGETMDGAELLYSETGSKLVINRQLSLTYSNGSQQVCCYLKFQISREHERLWGTVIIKLRSRKRFEWAASMHTWYINHCFFLHHWHSYPIVLYASTLSTLAKVDLAGLLYYFSIQWLILRLVVVGTVVATSM